MCANYELPMPQDFAPRFCPAELTFSYVQECFPCLRGVFIAREREDAERVAHRGVFGMLPHWAKDTLCRQTYNAPLETIDTQPNYRNAWMMRQLCLIPASIFYVPNYQTGSAARWGIYRKDGEPFALAGIWEIRMRQDGSMQRSYSMITVDAAAHPLMNQFYAPKTKNRSPIVIATADYDRWLQASKETEIRSLLHLIDDEEFMAEERPAAPGATDWLGG